MTRSTPNEREALGLSLGRTAHIEGLVREALAEDEREGSHFDAEGFFNSMPEEDPADITEAWRMYEHIIYGVKVHYDATP